MHHSCYQDDASSPADSLEQSTSTDSLEQSWMPRKRRNLLASASRASLDAGGGNKEGNLLRVATWNLAAPNNNPFEYWAGSKAPGPRVPSAFTLCPTICLSRHIYFVGPNSICSPFPVWLIYPSQMRAARLKARGGRARRELRVRAPPNKAALTLSGTGTGTGTGNTGVTTGVTWR